MVTSRPPLRGTRRGPSDVGESGPPMAETLQLSSLVGIRRSATAGRRSISCRRSERHASRRLLNFCALRSGRLCARRKVHLRGTASSADRAIPAPSYQGRACRLLSGRSHFEPHSSHAARHASARTTTLREPRDTMARTGARSQGYVTTAIRGRALAGSVPAARVQSPAAARSYSTETLGDDNSATVFLTNSPEEFADLTSGFSASVSASRFRALSSRKPGRVHLSA